MAIKDDYDFDKETRLEKGRFGWLYCLLGIPGGIRGLRQRSTVEDWSDWIQREQTDGDKG